MLSSGFKPDDRQTLLLSATANGRFADGSFDDALFGAAARYYWRQTRAANAVHRPRVDRGVNLDVDQQLTLGGDTGLRGYPFATGPGRAGGSSPSSSACSPTGIRFGCSTSVAPSSTTWAAPWVRAWSRPRRHRSTASRVLRDIGFGLRLGNSRSAVGNVVHVDIAYPLDGDPSISKFQLNVEAKRTF